MINTINYKTFIKEDIRKVWEAITTPEGLNAWFTKEVIVDLRPGGKMIIKWKGFGPDLNTFEDHGKILELVEPRHLSFQWTPAGKDNPTTVSFDLEQEYGGTILTVNDTGYPTEDVEYQKLLLECACGWGEALTLLKFHLEFGVKYQHPAPAEKW